MPPGGLSAPVRSTSIGIKQTISLGGLGHFAGGSSRLRFQRFFGSEVATPMRKLTEAGATKGRAPFVLCLRAGRSTVYTPEEVDIVLVTLSFRSRRRPDPSGRKTRLFKCRCLRREGRKRLLVVVEIRLKQRPNPPMHMLTRLKNAYRNIFQRQILRTSSKATLFSTSGHRGTNPKGA